MPRESRFHCRCWEVDVRPEEVEGFLTKVRARSPGVIVQVFASSSAPNPGALQLIAAQTLSATRSGSTLAERPELDLLLRLAGTRQIGEAFQRVGYKSDGRRLFLVVAEEGSGAKLRRVSEGLAREGKFSEVANRKLTKGDLEQVERAALLASRL